MTNKYRQQWRVRCWNCGWEGVRTADDCSCSVEWCTPGTPGNSDCTSSIVQPCPKCGPNVYSDRTELIRSTSILAVAPVKARQKTK